MFLFCQSLEPVDRQVGRHRVQFYTLQSKAYMYVGNYPKAQEMGVIAVQLAQNIKNSLEVVDSQLNLIEILKFMERNTESLALLDDCSHKIKQLKNITEHERNRRMGLCFFHQGGKEMAETIIYPFTRFFWFS